MTATDRFDVYPDATFVGLADRFDDVLAEPPGRPDELTVSALLASAITMSPSDLPAVELPDYEPTAADLAVVTTASEDAINARIEAATTLTAINAHRRNQPHTRGEGLPRAS